MIFQCSDLERALRTPDLMPEMRAHAAQCEAWPVMATTLRTRRTPRAAE